MSQIAHYDNCHIQVRRDYFLLCAYDKADYNQKKTKTGNAVKDEPSQECMAKILRVFETLTESKRQHWHEDAAKLKEQGLTPPNEPKEFPLVLSYGAIVELLYSTHGESTVRNSLAVLAERGYIKQYQPSKNGVPFYILNIEVLQEALKRQAESKLSAVDFDTPKETDKSQVSKSNGRVSKSTATTLKNQVSGVDFGRSGVEIDNNKNREETYKKNKNLDKNERREEPPTSPNPDASSLTHSSLHSLNNQEDIEKKLADYLKIIRIESIDTLRSRLRVAGSTLKSRSGQVLIDELMRLERAKLEGGYTLTQDTQSTVEPSPSTKNKPEIFAQQASDVMVNSTPSPQLSYSHSHPYDPSPTQDEAHNTLQASQQQSEHEVMSEIAPMVNGKEQKHGEDYMKGSKGVNVNDDATHAITLEKESQGQEKAAVTSIDEVNRVTQAGLPATVESPAYMPTKTANLHEKAITKTLTGKSRVPKETPKKRDLLAEVPPEVQVVVTEWRSIFRKPVGITLTLIEQATALAEFQPETGEIVACRLWMYKTDRKKWYSTHGMHLGDVVREFPKFRSLADIPDNVIPFQQERKVERQLNLYELAEIAIAEGRVIS